MEMKPVAKFEIITVLTLAGCYAAIGLATVVLPQFSLLLAFAVATFGIALHSSLQHEILHGHPTRSRLFNELLVFPAVGLLVPYGRFRDLHLAHHNDDILTDPYDDPESNFFDPAIWARTPGWLRLIFRANNTLFGRILLGPGISVIALIREDLKLIAKGVDGVLSAWILHAIGLLPVIWWLSVYATIPVWTYVLAAYFGFGLLKIRTYLEHRAYDKPAGRTVIIEDRGILAFLFLDNNFHVVHHTHPGEPWYRMQRYYFADPEKYRAMNDGYVYKNYWEVFRRFFFRAKDPVPHPLMENALSRKG